MDDRAVRRAWEGFVERGSSNARVRTAVFDSWERSRGYSVAVDRLATSTISEGELHRRRQRGGRLLQASRSALEHARNLLSSTGCMVMLADAKGVVLETAGDAHALSRGRDIGLQQGGLWGEADIGTNAIGTALVADAPVQIHASEHFCSRVQRWTCAAAPVHHPLRGHILGVIDLSGPPESVSPRNLAYAVAVAQQIEGALQHELDAENAAILRHFLGRRGRWHQEGLIAVGSCGRIVHATDSALRIIDRVGHALVEQGRIPILGECDPGDWREALHARVPEAGLELVTEQGREIGAVIVWPQRERTKVAAWRKPDRADAAGDAFSFDAIIGDSAVMRAACESARRMADSGASILIEGETGVGKELFARAIHDRWTPEGPFVPINCGGMPRDLIGSEIFGYARGAFTGADTQGKQGKIEAAEGGTFCLDEIGEMPLDLQPYLLRVLEDGMVYRIGSHQPRRVRTRLISMTHRDLAQECARGAFRSDLFYRIAVLRLRVPALHERGDDVVLLAEHFARRSAARSGRIPPVFSVEALDLLCGYHWPGNVRELRNVVETLMFLAEGSRIGAEHLPAAVLQSRPLPSSAADAPQAMDLRSLERDAIAIALRDSRGNLSLAARKLGIARSTLYCRLAGYGLRVPRS